jgi:SET domain-containing protein
MMLGWLSVLPTENVPVRAAADILWAIALRQDGVRPLELGRDVEVRPSAGKGLGVFALRRIPAGKLIARYDGAYRTVANQVKATGSITSGMYSWTLENECGRSGWCVDADDPKSSGWARYINHSLRRENLLAQSLYPPEWAAAFLPSPLAIWFESIKDIDAGEELLYDYTASYWDPLTPLVPALHEAVPRGSPLYKMNARLNPRRAIIDLF